MKPDSPAFENDDPLNSDVEHVEQLEATKAQLQADIEILRRDYEQLKAATQQQQDLLEISRAHSRAHSPAHSPAESQLPSIEATQIEASRPAAKYIPVQTSLDQLTLQSTSQQTPQSAAVRGPIELPIPSTSQQRRQQYLQRRAEEAINDSKAAVMPRRGVVLSAIAAGLMAWHFCLVGVLGQGGSWLGFPIDQLGTGFVPAVALLWMRMLVMVPALVILAPQLYRYTWEDLHDWIYTRDQLLVILIASGVALFLSQVLIYQCIGMVGPALGVMLLFLYPLTAVPLGAIMAPERRLSPLGGLSLVAIAMGGILAVRPLLSSLAAPVILGLVASLTFSLYIVLTNLSYRQQHCHPMPVAIVQFSTVAVLSSIVLLVRPLNPIDISWLSFSLWGILLGLIMLLVYLFSYSSLRLIGRRTAIMAAATPLATLLLAWSFTPQPTLVLLQWTGILLVTIGGIAFGQEKLNNFKP